MDDLLIGIVIMGLLSAVLFVASQRVSRKLSERMTHLLGILVVTLIVGFVVHVQGHVTLARYLPFSNLIVVSNWQPLLVSVLAGLIWHRMPGRVTRRSFITLALVGSCLLGVYRPILAKPPELADRWDGEVCLQTSRSSCSAAAAATLLALQGIPATEKEMALLCLTSEQGTPMQGLYRGLKIKTAGTGWDVYMFSGARLDDLRGSGPVLISVELRDRRFHRQLQAWGWIPGVPHSIVVLGFWGDKVIVADPAMGKELWLLKDLLMLWHGEGVRLVRSK